MKVVVNHLVSNRCKLVVQSELEKRGIKFSFTSYGEVNLESNLSIEELKSLNDALLNYGLELSDSKTTDLVLKIKNVIINMVHKAEIPTKINNSDYISKKLNQDYRQISQLFSASTGMSIAHYIILQKIERIKELLLYEELSLKEIAQLLNYSSVAHISNQFSKITHLTPRAFQQLKDYKRRIPLEEV